MVAQTTFTRPPFKHYTREGEAYFNTPYDTFYIGGETWSEFKILIDLLVKLNTTRPLREPVQNDLRKLQNIRLLIVDLNIFGAAPLRLWAEFPKLEVLTIAFYPSSTIKDKELRYRDPDNGPVRFITPLRGTIFGKRAGYIRKIALETLETLKNSEIPKWKIPTVEVVVRTTGEKRLDAKIEEQWSDDAGKKVRR